MKIVIEIDEEIYEHIKDNSTDSNDEYTVMRAIANGTVIVGYGIFLQEDKEKSNDTISKH